VLQVSRKYKTNIPRTTAFIARNSDIVNMNK